MKMLTPLAFLPSSSWHWVLCLAMLPALLVGCDNSSTPESGSVAGDGMTELPGEGEDEDASPWVGRWLFTITEQTNDFHPFLLQIEERNGQRGLQIIDRAPRPEFKDWKLKGASFLPDAMRLAIDTGNVTLMFEGKLYDDVFLGVVYPEGTPMPTPARFVKYSETSLRGFETPQLTEGVEEFQKATQAEDAVAALEKFIAENQNNPLVHQAYEQLLAEEIASEAAAERIQSLKEQVSETGDRWGGPLRLESLFTLASLLDNTTGYREIQATTLEELSEMLGEETPDQIKLQLELLKGKYLLASEAAEEQEVGEEKLQALLESQPFDFNAILALAKYYEQQGEPEKSLELYAKLAVAPGMSRMVGNIADPQTGDEVSLMEKTRSLFDGDDKQFEKFLDETYEQVVFYFVPEKKPSISLSENRRVPLIELFTGAMCPPCVAGDLALGGLEKVFPAPEAIVVRYHQHIPGPDPLTNTAGESRFSYYNGRGTPALFVNGQDSDSVGGYLVHAEQHFNRLLPQIATLLSKPSNVVIDLNASAEGETISISAKASGLSDDRPNMKLRLLLVEPMIHYVAPNGIRTHEMVVRDCPGGAGGKQAEGTSVSVEAKVNIAELKTQLAEQLSTFEANRNYEFDTKPLDMEQFRVVAFVQDDSNKEIFQSTISPVINVTAPKAAEKPAKPAEEKSDAKEEPAAGDADKADDAKAEMKPADSKEADKNQPEPKSDKNADKPADAAESEGESAKPEPASEESKAKPAEEPSETPKASEESKTPATEPETTPTSDDSTN